MARNQKAKDEELQATKPKFPYTTKPNSLRKWLKEVPKRPKPDKIDTNLLKAWGFRDSNDATMLRVLKAVNLLDGNNTPTETYTAFMNLAVGVKALGPEVKKTYAPLFQASHEPYKESSETLKNLFNIHSGGGDRVIEYQIATFKALCENALFETASGVGAPSGATTTASLAASVVSNAGSVAGAPIVNINLHIHLPENKTRRDYEDIIEDIGRYIFGRGSGERRD